MAIPKWARRVGFGAGGQLTPEEAGFYPAADRDANFSEGRRARLVFSRIAPAGLFEDAAQIDFEFVNSTGGVLDNTWIDADFVQLETAITAWWNSVKVFATDGHVLDQIRWYKFGPSLPVGAGGGEMPGAPVRVVDRDLPGSQVGGKCMYQMAVSVTMKTATRKRWGRVYIPGITAAELTAAGRLGAVGTAGIADATSALAGDAAANDFRFVVYSPTRRTAFSIESIQVDDIPDVIRSRRPRQTGRRDKRDT